MNVNTANLLNFLLLASFVHKGREVSANNDKQRTITRDPQLKNNSDKAPETQTRSLITVMKENLDASEVKLSKANFKFREKLQTSNKVNVDNKVISNVFRRKTEHFVSKNTSLQCISCYGIGSSNSDNDCYLGLSSTTEQCRNKQECYVELHPQFIKRGCITKSTMNRVFRCNCPLCNDKPYDDSSYYDYETIRDWEYDNKRLEASHIGMDLICKVCETKGTATADKVCRLGKYANYMMCGHNQVCYTEINYVGGLVSRGCTDKPSYNSYYKFCNSTLCNLTPFNNPNASKIGIIQNRKKVLVSSGFKINGKLKSFLTICLILNRT